MSIIIESVKKSKYNFPDHLKQGKPQDLINMILSIDVNENFNIKFNDEIIGNIKIIKNFKFPENFKNIKRFLNLCQKLKNYNLNELIFFIQNKNFVFRINLNLNSLNYYIQRTDKNCFSIHFYTKTEQFLFGIFNKRYELNLEPYIQFNSDMIKVFFKK